MLAARVERTHSKLWAGGHGWAGGGWQIRQGNGWQSGQFPICILIKWEEQLGSETKHATHGSSAGNKASKPLTEKTCGG